MSVGYDRPLFILAFDHRTSFVRGLFGIQGRPSAAELETISNAKELILEGLLQVVDGVPRERIGALVDEELGSSAAHRAKSAGLQLAICAEKSNTIEFELAYGDDFARHIDAFDPDFVKVLARYDPDGDHERNQRQADRLATLSDWLARRGRRFLFELLVPRTDTEQARTDGNAVHGGRGSDAEKVTTAMGALRAAGVDPDIWKVQGFSRRADYELISRAARAGNRPRVSCVVLGAGAPEPTVLQWLAEAASVEAFIGFALGRTLWWDALSQWRTGALDSSSAPERIAHRFRRAVETFVANRPAARLVQDKPNALD